MASSILIGLAVLMVFTFMSILILLAANHNDLSISNSLTTS